MTHELPQPQLSENLRNELAWKIAIAAQADTYQEKLDRGINGFRSVPIEKILDRSINL